MDLTYSFLQDSEPTEAQLKELMKEVAVDARKRKRNADKNFLKLIRHEIKLAAKRSKLLTK